MDPWTIVSILSSTLFLFTGAVLKYQISEKNALIKKLEQRSKEKEIMQQEHEATMVGIWKEIALLQMKGRDDEH